MQYFSLDPAGAEGEEVLRTVKEVLAGGVAAMFGFVVYDSIEQAAEDGCIPFPGERDRTVGGHAVLAVGYDDGLEVTNQVGGETTKGAVLIRNSWGSDWGEKGYGWLPYEYVQQGLAADWWSLLMSEWVDVGEFGVG